MSRPKQVVPLFLGGAGMWVVHLMLVGTSRDANPLLEQSSSILAVALANLAFWLGVLLNAAALLLLVLAWDRAGRETAACEQPAGVDHYS